MPSRPLIWWAYAVELIASGLALLALCAWFGSASVAKFVRDVALDSATLFGAVMFAASLGFLWTFYSKSDTPFYKWLDEIGAFSAYLAATGYAVAVSVLSTLTLVALKSIESEAFSLFAAFLLILAIVNLYTLVKNVVGLMTLNTSYNKQRDRDV